MPAERFTALAAVLGAIRAESGITQPAVAERVGLGRSVVADRVAELESAGLVVPDGHAVSTGGRAARRLKLNAGAGVVLGIDIALNELVVAVADLSGSIVSTRQEQIDFTAGPEFVLARAEAMADALIDDIGGTDRLWGCAVGLPGPVVFETGVPPSVAVMPGWGGYPVKQRLEARWSRPVWVDNRVNLLALGEIASNPTAASARHMLYFGAGSGNGAALVIDGQLYRGAHGLAGSVGHVPAPGAGIVVCRCGKVGCLEAVAGGWAIARDGQILAESGQSSELAAIVAQRGAIRALDVTRAADRGDVAARQLLERASGLLGMSLATLVSFFAPELLIIGGGVARAGAYVLGPIREAVLSRVMPVAAADLRIELSVADEEIAGVLGAAALTLSQLFAKEQLAVLLESRPIQKAMTPGAIQSA